MPRFLLFLTLVSVVAATTACGDDGAAGAPDDGADGADATARGIRVVPVDEAVALHENPTDGMVVLDVRTPAEFADGHLEGAVLVDFMAPDFRERLEDLDPETPYLMYCRSGNRSGQARAVMAELGFVDVADIEGGTLAWAAAGHPLVAGS